jgi:hypothetical protein
LFDLLSFSFPDFQFDFSSRFLYQYWIPLSYPVLSSFFHSAFYLYPLVIIKILIHVVFNFIYNSYGHSFELFEILFTSVSFASYCEIVDFLGESYYLIFHISCVSLLRFMHMSPSHLLKYWSWNSNNVLARLGSGSVAV